MQTSVLKTYGDALVANEACSVPQGDGIDDKVEARGVISHDFGKAIPQLTKLLQEHSARKGMTAFAFVKDGMQSASQRLPEASRR
ncbi:hypothetical protein [Sinorhizobium psoraleae]|uniref:hypothetical protein n=1 Tax=Sinorhizobium psoraleae TaxID=520838 RepID=UPI00406B963E